MPSHTHPEAMIGLPDFINLTKSGTLPATPAMQDIVAIRWLSISSATEFASWATLEQPEQEYTMGFLLPDFSFMACYTEQSFGQIIV